MRARTSSGSAASDASVKPTRSQKRTETTFRSSPAATGAASTRGAAHSLQNFAVSPFSKPHLGHLTTRRLDRQAILVRWLHPLDHRARERGGRDLVRAVHQPCEVVRDLL